MALELARARPGLRGHGLQVLRALRRHRRRHEHARRHGLWDEEDGFYYDQILTRTGRPSPLRDPLAGRPDPAVRGRGARRTSDLGPAAAASASAWTGSSRTARTWRDHIAYMDASADGARPAPAGHPLPRAARARAALPARRERVPLAATASARSPGPTATTPSRSPLDGARTSRALRARRVGQRAVRRQLELARPGLVPAQLPADRGAASATTTSTATASGSSARRARAAAAPRARSRDELARRLVRPLPARTPAAAAPATATDARYARDPHCQDLVLFYEYFHGDTGRGCGASHQTGWTALVASLIRDLHRGPIKMADPRPVDLS